MSKNNKKQEINTLQVPAVPAVPAITSSPIDEFNFTESGKKSVNYLIDCTIDSIKDDLIKDGFKVFKYNKDYSFNYQAPYIDSNKAKVPANANFKKSIYSLISRIKKDLKDGKLYKDVTKIDGTDDKGTNSKFALKYVK